MIDDFPETLEESLKILDENLEILANLEIDIEDSKEGDLETDMELYQLFDFAEDISESSKIRRAELNLIKRQEESL